jgi:hypothetical protein
MKQLANLVMALHRNFPVSPYAPLILEAAADVDVFAKVFYRAHRQSYRIQILTTL